MTFYKKFGYVCMSMVGFQILKVLYKIGFVMLGKKFGYVLNVKDYGQWAVITGATLTIGRAFAEALAARGLNLVIFGHNEEELCALAKELTDNYLVTVDYFEVNFIHPTQSYKKISEILSGYDIGVLVNSTGVNYTSPENFLDHSCADKDMRRAFKPAIYNRIVSTNIYPVTHMCRIVLKDMVKRRKGIIINVASAIGVIPSPYMTLLGAAKAYIVKFTADLRAEYLKDDIYIQCLIPAFVSKEKSPYLSWVRPSPKEYVESALQTVGISNETTGFLPQTMMILGIRYLQYFSNRWTKNLIIRIVYSMRARALARIMYQNLCKRRLLLI